MQKDFKDLKSVVFNTLKPGQKFFLSQAPDYELVVVEVTEYNTYNALYLCNGRLATVTDRCVVKIDSLGLTFNELKPEDSGKRFIDQYKDEFIYLQKTFINALKVDKYIGYKVSSDELVYFDWYDKIYFL